jgi:hypothetical protein
MLSAGRKTSDLESHSDLDVCLEENEGDNFYLEFLLEIEKY